MKSKINKISRGFTIIEVMIVLAIAGLILVVIFVAIPEVQRNARDHKREIMATQIIDALNNYSERNDGQLPVGDSQCTSGGDNTGQFCDFYNRYIKGKIDDTDPSTGKSVFQWDMDRSGGAADIDPCGIDAPVPAGQPCVHFDWVDGNGDPVISTGDATILLDSRCQDNRPVSTGVYDTRSIKAGVSYTITIGLDRPGTFLCLGN